MKPCVLILGATSITVQAPEISEKAFGGAKIQAFIAGQQSALLLPDEVGIEAQADVLSLILVKP